MLLDTLKSLGDNYLVRGKEMNLISYRYLFKLFVFRKLINDK